MGAGRAALFATIACSGAAWGLRAPARPMRRPTTSPRTLLRAEIQCEDVCIVPPDDLDASATDGDRMLPLDVAMVMAPFVAPACGFLLYERLAGVVRYVLDGFAHRSFYTVDGGVYEIQILTPAINGIVVPCISIALGTLCATTIGALRQRQETMRACLNTEACELHILRSVIAERAHSLPAPVRLRALGYLRSYAGRVLEETAVGVNVARVERSGVGDNELHGLLALVHRQRPPAGLSAWDAAWLQSADSLAVSLSRERSQRLATLASTFPPLHWGIILLSEASILAAFLIESDQEVLRFLDSVQLRILFTFLVGTFSALDALMLDLVRPFSGIYRISGSRAQMLSFRQAVECDMCADVVVDDGEATGERGNQALEGAGADDPGLGAARPPE